MQTYQQSTRTELGLTVPEWETLKEYVDDLQTSLKRADKQSDPVEGIEEQPPSVEGGTFKPRGWFGEFPGGVRVEPNRFDNEEETALLSDLGGWADMIGGTTFEAAFPVSTDLLADQRTQLAGYSNALIELTEVLRSGRLPTTVKRVRKRGPAPDGRPLMDETMRAEAQGSDDIVTEQLEFSFDTQANHLLVRFHADLSSRLRELADEYSIYEDAFDRQLRYHEFFLNQDLAQQVLDQAVRTDFTAPETLRSIRESASDTMSEIVDLWESYQRGRRLETRIEDQLNTAVKPISKIYELWCLGVLLEFFEEIYQTSPDAGQIAGTYTITPDVTLLYNSSVYRYSNYLTSAFEVGAGRPDFALVVDDKLVWIGDAKSKSWDSLQLSDYQRFLTYILDLLSVDQTGSILYAEKERPAQRQTVRDFEVQHVPLRPGGKQKAMKSLRDLLSPQLPAVPSTPNQS